VHTPFQHFGENDGPVALFILRFLAVKIKDISKKGNACFLPLVKENMRENIIF